MTGPFPLREGEEKEGREEAGLSVHFTPPPPPPTPTPAACREVQNGMLRALPAGIWRATRHRERPGVLPRSATMPLPQGLG